MMMHIVYENAAVEYIQELKADFIRDLLDEIGLVVSGKECGADGIYRVTTDDVRRARRRLWQSRTLPPPGN
jgi:hypothetical protein